MGSKIWITGVAAAAAMLAAPAHASTSIHLQFGVPGAVYAPYGYGYSHPGYVYAQPAYVEPVYVVPRPVYRHGYGYRRDQDRDGIPNRWDRDRDGDGVPNRFDRRPANPYWR